MALKSNVSGVWKDIVAWTNVSGTWKKCSVWTNVGGVWKKLTSLVAVYLPATINATSEVIDPADANATFSVSSAGTFDGDSPDTWLLSGAASDYDVNFQPSAGTVSTGVVNSWQNCGTTRTWTRNRTTIGSNVVTGTLKFRMAASPFTELASGTLTLTATVTT